MGTPNSVIMLTSFDDWWDAYSEVMKEMGCSKEVARIAYYAGWTDHHEINVTKYIDKILEV